MDDVRELLDREERRTRRALSAATRTAGRRLESAIDLPGRVRRNPFTSLGIAAVTGFVVTRLGRRTARSMLAPALTGAGARIAQLLVHGVKSSRNVSDAKRSAKT